MKVERKKNVSLKNYYIQKRKDFKETDFNIYLYEDDSKEPKEYLFVFTNENGEKQTIEDRKNIITVFPIPNPDNVRFFVNQLGKAVSEIRSLNRPVMDYDFIDSIKKNIATLNLPDPWISKSATRFVSIAEKQDIVKQKENRKEAFNNMSEDDKIINAIKPVILINLLEKLGYITISGTSDNSDELKHKISFVDINNHGSTIFNISAVRQENLNSPKSGLFNDFNNSRFPQTGSSAIGLINHFGAYGLYKDFKTFDINDKDEMIIIAKEFLIEKIIPFVDKKDLVYSDAATRMLFIGNSITIPPIKQNYKNNTIKYRMDVFRDFFEYRGLSKKLINNLVEKDIIFVGDSYTSRLQKKQEKDKNYSMLGSQFISLMDYNKNLSSAEKFTVYKNKKTSPDEKPFTYSKMNIDTLDGKFFGMGELKNPKCAIIHEAAIDAMSSYELIAESETIDPNSVFYVSTQGTSHMKGFFSHNMGFSVDVKDNFKPDYKNNGQRMQTVNYTTFKNKLTEDDINLYKDKLKNKKLILVSEKNEKINFSTNKIIELLSKTVEIPFEIKKVDSIQNINFEQFNKDNDLIITSESLKSLCKELHLSFDYNKETKSFDISKTRIKEYTNPFNSVKNKNYLHKKVVDFFGTDHLVYCLDNDSAALQYMIYFSEMEKNIGINVSYMIPDDISYKDSSLTQGIKLKDFVDDFKKLCSIGKHEDAYSLLSKYASQKPSSDNNDVLKYYLNMKKENPQKAKEYLSEKISFGLNLNDTVLSKKKILKAKP